MKYKNSFSNILIIISTIVTIFSVISPWILDYWMSSSFIQNKDYFWVLIQFILYGFLHWWLLHLLSNWLFIFIFWNQVENYIWSKKFWIFFFLNTIFVWIWLILFSHWNTIWISGFAMAILWYYFMILKRLNNPEYKSALFLLIINIAIWFSWDISLIWHLFWAIFWISFFYVDGLFFSKK